MTEASSTSDGRPDRKGPRLGPRDASGLLARQAVTFICAAGLFAIVGGLNIFGRPRTVFETFFLEQDVPVLVATALVLAALARLRLRPAAPFSLNDRTAVNLITAACALVALAGTYGVYCNYPLSMDEFMAQFDAAIFSHGRLFGELPGGWPAYKAQLQPMFLAPMPSAAHWGSAYLPVNAAVRALGRSVGLEVLVNPLWTAWGVVATWAVGRRLWPQQPATALTAAVLVATSSQVLVTGMTAYAMPAHLALNMAWLWCFLRGGRAGHTAALVIGFAATGLHQLVFHPLFVAPFVLHLWLGRRWALATLYTLAYGAIGLFWSSWWQIAFALLGFPEMARAAGAGGLIDRAVHMVSARDLDDIPLMARNLARFVAWQNPLAVAPAILGAVAALRAGPILRSLVLGVVATTLAIAVILPFQGHGWGYRYLHGVIGSVCLLAAWTWSRTVEALAPEERGKAWAGFVGAAVLSVLVALPVHAWQVHRFVAPYARASARIAAADADVVLVNERGVRYGIDLVRNDPFLTNRPIILRLAGLGEARMKALCAQDKVALFDRDAAMAAGIALTGGRVPSKPPTLASASLPPACP